jgi:hypothetical protein
MSARYDRLPIPPDEDRAIFYVGTGETPLTMNQLVGKHWSAYNRHINSWKDAVAGVLGMHRSLRSRQYRTFELHFFPLYPTSHRGELPDTAALAPVTKGIVDGLVAAGVLFEDNPHHNDVEHHHAGRRRDDVPWPIIEVHIGRRQDDDEHIICSCRTAYESKRAGAAAGRKGQR